MRRILKTRIRRSSSRRTIRTARPGITLVEVLVSVFVLTIGILGVIAALPIGVWSLNQAKIADRSTACARGALNDARVRGLTDPDRIYPAADPTKREQNVIAYAIDPRMYGDVATRSFPFDDAGGIPRYTLNFDANDFPPRPMDPALAERLFVWGDQIKFTTPTDEESRPDAIFRVTSSGAPICSDTEGEFSWMLTVSPRVKRIYKPEIGANSPWIYEVTHREVTAVVFHKRITDLVVARATSEAPATERQVDCEFFSGGIGGGDVVLSGAAFDLDLENTDYLMLHGNRSSNSEQGTVCQWYKILSYSEIEPDGSGGAEILVSLAGPDWRFNLDGGQPKNCKAVVCQGVTAAYTTTISAEESWRWND